MAGCGEVDCLAPTKLKEEAADSSSSSSSSPECSICLQSCVHPVRLPCCHVFCYLCVKGASWHSKRCALCRQEIPEDFLERPVLLSPEELKLAAAGVSRGGGNGDSSLGEYAWYYEGRNGWWQYDERTSCELEEAFAKGRKSTEMLIAGFLYVADLENMVQYRRNEHGRRRKMKRDVVGIPKKGVAGLRLDPEPVPIPVLPVVSTAAVQRVSSADGADGQSQSMNFGIVVAVPPVRPPTVLGGHLASPPSPSPLTLEESLDQLLITQPEGEEEAEEEAENRIPSQTSASGSSESEDERQECDRGRPESLPPPQSQRQRLTGRPVRENQPDRTPPRGGAAAAGATLSLRSRSPDGQCTVTEV
ncbi:E3 ubiquitin-protein ligase RNF146-B-like [Genypterus blacodes]|uniref:E3 ubiquitin-protein ligase RNF146-B-like n=1 Tax=Genypterus blacodes TaxID=154954 RepID=UPI003F7730E6